VSKAKHSPRQARLLEEIAQELLKDLLDDYLTGDVIPDILIQALTSQDGEYDPFSPEDQAVYEAYEAMMRSVVNGQVEAVVRGVIREFMDDFLKVQANKRGRNPLVAEVHSLVESTLSKMTRVVVREALSEMVDEYLFMQQFDSVLDGLLEPLVAEVAEAALDETDESAAQHELVEAVVGAMASEVASEALSEMQERIFSRRKRDEFAAVSALAERIINRKLLTELVCTVASRGESVLFRTQVEHLLCAQIAKALLGTVRQALAPQQRLGQSRALRVGFQLATSRAVTGQIFQEFLRELDAFEDELERSELTPGNS